MSEQEWKGGRGDPRLYRQVRAEKQSILRAHFERIRPFLDERGRRLWAANEAVRFGRGGIRAVAEALGMSQMTVVAGVKELKGDLHPGTDEMRLFGNATCRVDETFLGTRCVFNPF